ncbi:hypothetical protein JCM3770_004777 [Rhodotorula araucariae]
MGYVSVLLAGDEQKRSLTIACMNAFGSAVATIYGYDTNKAPRFPRGISLSLAFVAFEVCCVFAVATSSFVNMQTAEVAPAVSK